MTNENVTSKPPGWFGDGRRRVRGADLEGVDLAGADLAALSFTGVSLSGADLAGAAMTGVRMNRVRLKGANLAGADLRGAELRNVDLASADLSGANLCGATLDTVSLLSAKLDEAILTGCRADSVDFGRAELRATRFDGATLRASVFDHTTLVGSDLAGTSLEDCEITDSTLDACDLSGARVTRCTFARVALHHCTVRGAALLHTCFQQLDVTESDFTATFASRSEGLSTQERDVLLAAGAKLGADGGRLWPKRVSAAPDSEAPDTAGSRNQWVGTKVGQADLEGKQIDSLALCSISVSRLRWSHAPLRGVALCNAELSGVELSHADLNGADLRSAEISGVDLSGADLRGADLRGAVLEDSNLTGARLDGADLRGASLISVVLVEASLDQARLDGCNIEDARLASTSLTGTSAQGSATSNCDFRHTRWTDCDLSGSRHQHARFRGSTAMGCDLRGARLDRADMADFEATDTVLENCHLVRCSGVRRDARSAMEKQGARFHLNLAARTVEEVRSRPVLRNSLLVAVVVLVLAATAFASIPQLWPTVRLASRMQALADAGASPNCDKLVRLGSVLQQREMTSPAEQVALLSRVDSCYQGMDPFGEERRNLLATSERILLEYLGDSDLKGEVRLRAMMLLRETYLAQDIDPEQDERWFELHRQLAHTLLELPGPSSADEGDLEQVVAVLVYAGDLELATRIIAKSAQQFDDVELWTLLDNTLAHMLRDSRNTETLSLLVDLSASRALTVHPVFPLVVLAQLDLLLSTQQGDAADELIESLESAEPPSSRILLALARARLELAAGRAERAISELVGLETDEGVPADLVGYLALTRMEAHFALDDEAPALEIAGEYLETVQQPRVAERFYDRASRMSIAEGVFGTLNQRLGEIDNAVVSELLGDLDHQVESLRLSATEGVLRPDDPQVTALLLSGEEYAIREVLDLVFQSASHDRRDEDVVATLSELARGADGTLRLAVGMKLVENAYHYHNDCTAAEAVADDLGLWDLADEDQLAMLLEVSARAAMESGEAERAELQLLRAYDLENDRGSAAAAVISVVYMDWLRDLGECPKVLEVARTVRERSTRIEEMAQCTERVAMCLAMLGRTDELVAELDQLAKEASSCKARTVEAQAFEMVQRPLDDLEPLVAACSSRQAPLDLRIAAIDYLSQRGDAILARKLLDGIESAPIDQRDQLAVAEARVLSLEGQSRSAIDLLDSSIAKSPESWQRQMLIHEMISLLSSSGDTEGIVERYTKHSNALAAEERFDVWTVAAEALIQHGQADRIPDLGEDPAWSQALAGPIQIAEFRDLLSRGEHEEAMEILKQLAAKPMEPHRAVEVAWIAVELARSTGKTTEVLATLDTLRAAVPKTDDAWYHLSLESIRLLDQSGRSDEALVAARKLLEEDLAPRRLEWVAETAASLAGRHLEATEVEALLEQLESLGLTRRVADASRVTAADGLLRRSLNAEARRLLAPLEGRALSAEQVRSQYLVLAQAWADGEDGADVEALLKRFPPEGNRATCLAHVALVGQLPWESDGSKRALDTAYQVCEAGDLDVWTLESLVNYYIHSDRTEEALRLVNLHASAISTEEQPRLRLVRAQAMMRGDDRALAEARTELERLAEDDDADRGIASDAMAALVSDVYTREEFPIVETEARVERFVERVGPATSEARRVLTPMVDLERSQGRLAKALQYQSDIVDFLPSDSGFERAWQLTQLARLHLDENGGQPSAKVMQSVDDALKASVEGECCLDELLPLQIALDVARARQAGQSTTMTAKTRLEGIPSADKERVFETMVSELMTYGHAELVEDLRAAGAPWNQSQ